MRLTSLILALPALALPTACGTALERGQAGAELFERPFSRPVVDAAGGQVGTVSGTPGDNGVVMSVAVRGLPPGQHGMHLHEAGRCDPPAFASAGGHWNAAARKHGHDNPQGPHDGDWGNLAVGADGAGTAERVVPNYHGKIPAAGLALVIHADPDDEKTDPSGNSGARIACAVLKAPG